MDLNILKCKNCVFYQELCLEKCPEDTILNSSNNVCDKKK